MFIAHVLSLSYYKETPEFIPPHVDRHIWNQITRLQRAGNTGKEIVQNTHH